MPHVLIVEDDEDMRVLERMALEHLGYEVSEARNGLEAINRLTLGTRPCVILLDLMMPIMDGLSFLKARARLPEASGIPVICLTAAGSELIDQALPMGVADCLHKPSDMEQLCALVEKYCRDSIR